VEDRLAKHLLENNILTRLTKTEDDIALLQKLGGSGESIITTIINPPATPNENKEEYGVSGSALDYGNLVYQSSLDERWWLVDTNTDATCKNRLGMCLLAVSSAGKEIKVLTDGKITDSVNFPVMAAGSTMYAGTTPGIIQTTPPSTTPGEIIRIVGHAISSAELYFHPSNDYFEIGEGASISASPSLSPSMSPSASISSSPSASPSASPSTSTSPSKSVSASPSTSPSASTSASPSASKSPSASQSSSPSMSPSASTSASPSASPSSASNIPVGIIQMYGAAVAPTGFLICDGSAISRVTYSVLFAVIGTTYGVGNGSTTFNIPNLKGKVAVGLDAAQTEFDALGEVGGEKTHALTTAELAAHGHTQDAHTHTQNAHTHTQDSHTHGNDTHNHTQNPHNHIPNAHNHATYNTGKYTGVTTGATGAAMYSSGFELDIRTSDESSSILNETAANNATSISITGATPTNQNATPTNQNATATNQNAGSGSAHNNLQPYITLNYIISY